MGISVGVGRVEMTEFHLSASFVVGVFLGEGILEKGTLENGLMG